MRPSLSIIGAGRVGRVLGRKLRERGWKIVSVAARSEASARRAVRFIGAGHPQAGTSAGVLSARVILFAAPDSAVGHLAEELAAIGGRELHAKVALHTSGALPAGILEPLRQRGSAVGSMHPLQTFTGIGMPSLEGRIFTMDGDPAAVRVARQMARDFGALPVLISSSAKAAYHAAATLACGQILAVIEAATRILMSVGMKRREAVRALVPLTRQMLQNFERLGPTAAWTGALSRRDFGVVEAHQAALQLFAPEFGEAYDALNRLSARVLAQDSEEMLARLAAIRRDTISKAKAIGGPA